MAVKTKTGSGACHYRGGKGQPLEYPEPKRLSKLGEWMRANPDGIGLVVHDMRAVMR